MPTLSHPYASSAQRPYAHLELLGFSHHDTPLPLREALSSCAAASPQALQEMAHACGLRELIILGTCNRIECYAVAEVAPLTGMQKAENDNSTCLHSTGLDSAPATAALRRRLARAAPQACDYAATGGLALSGEAAVRHLFRVASSLESMVIGEPQILGQVKDAFRLAHRSGLARNVLSPLFQHAFRTAKRVRAETEIGRYPVSISSVAVQLAQRIFDRLEERRVLVIGAGEMAELALRQLRAAGVRSIRITNRTHAHAVALAEKMASVAVPFAELERELASVEIVLASTGAPTPILKLEQVQRVMRTRRGQPIFFIDIALPRDVDPAVNTLPGVYRYDLDDLQQLALENRQMRSQALWQAQEIVNAETRAHLRGMGTREASRVIAALRADFQHTSAVELAQVRKRLTRWDTEQRVWMERELMRFTHNLVNKLLHPPSAHLHTLGADPEEATWQALLLSEWFGLEPAAVPPARPASTPVSPVEAEPSSSAGRRENAGDLLEEA